MPPPAELLPTLFNALPDSAVGGVNNSKLYVNRAAAPEYDAVANLRQYVQWAPASDESYLFSGLRGSGKTTELNRFSTELRNDGIAAYYCDASTYLNLNDPQLSLAELLMTALAGLADATRKDFGADFLVDNIWQRTKRLLGSDVQLKPSLKLTLGGAEAEVEATLQENPDFRKALVDFASSSTSFYEAAVEYAEEVAKLIRTKTGCQKIVLIVDSLERLSAPTGDESKLFDSLKELFSTTRPGCASLVSRSYTRRRLICTRCCPMLLQASRKPWRYRTSRLSSARRAPLLLIAMLRVSTRWSTLSSDASPHGRRCSVVPLLRSLPGCRAAT